MLKCMSKQKAEGRKQQAVGSRQKSRRYFQLEQCRLLPPAFCLLPTAYGLLELSS